MRNFCITRKGSQIIFTLRTPLYYVDILLTLRQSSTFAIFGRTPLKIEHFTYFLSLLTKTGKTSKILCCCFHYLLGSLVQVELKLSTTFLHQTQPSLESPKIWLIRPESYSLTKDLTSFVDDVWSLHARLRQDQTTTAKETTKNHVLLV